jgi:hypothetical protein
VRSRDHFFEIQNAGTARKLGMNFTLSNIGLCLSSALVVASVAAPVHAQTPNYSVEARASTGTMPGSGITYVGPIAGDTSAHAINDPPALQWVYNLNQVLYSDAFAESWTDIGSLAMHASALAQRVKATNFPTGVPATTMGRWTDRVVVTSATLPVGTPVTLTFSNTLSIDWQGSGLYDGKASCQFQVGGASTTASWSASYDKPEASVAGAPLVVKTTVGATLGFSARLDTMTRGWFFVPGPRYDGQMELDGACEQGLVSATGDVELLAESGFEYAAS